ncbi:DUF6036 family nucleotidyltransferase [Nannocystis sp. SCPEA4]|uniref:DUF6036 family nucleotidyltransferase n=1 Tax=Nannocystis sp. SCPEA4 TaxID=2996787 RepID=UPI0022730EBB|nr:hypothetical protein [Nannocystis sp. SCPEA4]
MASTTLPSHFSEFLQLLNQEKVEYLLVGGWAVGLHGRARYTADIDFWYRLDPVNASRVLRVLNQFGIDDPALTQEVLLSRGRIFRMGWPPMRIELLNTIDGVEFDACYERRYMLTVDDVEIAVISRDDLIANKRASNRPKDLADVDELGG